MKGMVTVQLAPPASVVDLVCFIPVLVGVKVPLQVVVIEPETLNPPVPPSIGSSAKELMVNVDNPLFLKVIVKLSGKPTTTKALATVFVIVRGDFVLIEALAAVGFNPGKVLVKLLAAGTVFVADDV